MVKHSTKAIILGAMLAVFILWFYSLFFKTDKKLDMHNKVVFFKTEQHLVVVRRHTIYLYDIADKKYVQTLYQTGRHHTIRLEHLSNALSPNRDFLLFFEQHKNSKKIDLALYSFSSGHIFRYPVKSLPTSFNFINNDSLFVYWSNGEAIYIDLKANNIIKEQLASLESVIALAPHHTITVKRRRGLRDRPSSVISPDGRYLANFQQSGAVIELNGDEKIIFSQPKFTKFPALQTFSPDSKSVATVVGSNIIVTNLETQQKVWQKHFNSGHRGPLTINYSPDGSKLLAGGSLSGQIGAIFIYDSSNGKLIMRLLGAND